MITDEPPLILVVDDDPTNIMLLSHILKKSNYRVGQASSGRECLAYVEEAKPDLIILDIRMPEMDGFETCRRLKERPDVADVPVMFLTAEGRSDENVEAGFGAGAIDYITKPFSRADVLARIQLVLKQRQAEQTYRAMATKDPLTGLDNRRSLQERLNEMLSNATRHDRPLAVAMVDLDKFKSVNDTYGHDFGDQVLIGFAEMLRTKSRMEDVVCRFGGEEFVVAMPDTTLDTARSVAERLRIAWEQTTFQTPNGRDIHVTASFGVARAEQGEGPADMDSVLKRADIALYAAKHQGRNRVIVYDDTFQDADKPAHAATSAGDA